MEFIVLCISEMDPGVGLMIGRYLILVGAPDRVMEQFAKGLEIAELLEMAEEEGMFQASRLAG